MWAYLSLAALLLGVAACELKSPCPGLFDYDAEAKDGKYEGTLTLQSDHKLHGVWVRVFFNNAVKELKILGDQATVYSDNAKEFLIKEKTLVLNKKEPTKVRFSVSYEGSSPPALIGYRLNARDVCPEGQD